MIPQTGKVPCIEIYFGDYVVNQDLSTDFVIIQKLCLLS